MTETQTETTTLAQRVETRRTSERNELYRQYVALIDKLDEPAAASEAQTLKYLMSDLGIDDGLFAAHVQVRAEARQLAELVTRERGNLYAVQRQIAAGGVPIDTAAVVEAARSEAAADPMQFPEVELHVLDRQAGAVEQSLGSMRDLMRARGAAGTAMTSATIKLRRLKTDYRELLVDVVPQRR